MKDMIQAVTAEGLSKTYESGKNALDNVSFSLSQGEIFGFLGPNGSGKTTTVKLLTGMLGPSAGACRVFGADPTQEPDRVHEMSGIVTEHSQMYGNLTGLENLIFFAALFGLSEQESRLRAQGLLEQLDLLDAANNKLASYSTGMRQRLSLARAMIHKPRILFLDEPTSGLDPEIARGVNGMIRELAKQEGTTVFLCTHQLRYAEEVCTLYGLVDEGSLLALGSIESLRAQTGSGLTAVLKADALPESITSSKLPDGTYLVPITSEEEIPDIIARVVAADIKLFHVSTSLPTLEDLYFALIEKKNDRGAL